MFLHELFVFLRHRIITCDLDLSFFFLLFICVCLQFTIESVMTASIKFLVDVWNKFVFCKLDTPLTNTVVGLLPHGFQPFKRVLCGRASKSEQGIADGTGSMHASGAVQHGNMRLALQLLEAFLNALPQRTNCALTRHQSLVRTIQLNVEVLQIELLAQLRDVLRLLTLCLRSDDHCYALELFEQLRSLETRAVEEHQLRLPARHRTKLVDLLGFKLLLLVSNCALRCVYHL